MHNAGAGVLCIFTKMINHIISEKASLEIRDCPERLCAFFTTKDMSNHFLLTYF